MLPVRRMLTACHRVVQSTRHRQRTLQGAEPAAGRCDIIFSAHWPHVNVIRRQKDEVRLVDWLPLVTGMKDLFRGKAFRCYCCVIVLRAAILRNVTAKSVKTQQRPLLFFNTVEVKLVKLCDLKNKYATTEIPLCTLYRSVCLLFFYRTEKSQWQEFPSPS